ncbi:hypothetical protein C8046_02395 [Serinibacter arcticus]|uniref:HNH nuclease domain-containing protein n=1 Tax=Serinibacter arcticus TaxID=1655435 RepID=A0A2U1ZZ80_9MICO|nr:hypothetical protein C8046_02395 [Serinibacter arcticus]
MGGLPPQLLVTIGLADLEVRTGLSLADAVQQAAGQPPPPASDSAPAPSPTPTPTPTPSPHLPTPGAADTRPHAPTSARTGQGLLPHAGPVPAGLLRRLACDADVIPVVLGGGSELLDLGTKQRLVPAALRKALIARDGGCLFPGCPIPPTWTEGHHVITWAAGGPTTSGNTCLLCPAHHHAVHLGRWVVERTSSTAPGPSRPFRITSPWSARPEQTWNAYPLGA